MFKVLCFLLLALSVGAVPKGSLTGASQVIIPEDGVDYAALQLQTNVLGSLARDAEIITPTDAPDYGLTSYTNQPYMLFFLGDYVIIKGEIIPLTAYSFPDMVVTEPTTNYPVSFAAFAPNVTNRTPYVGSPEISVVLDVAQPGDSITYSAENISTTNSTFVFYGEGTTEEGNLLKHDGRLGAVELPSTLPTNEVYMVWAFNENGFSYPSIINKTTSHWIHNNVNSTGGVFHITGRNITARGSETTYCYVEETDEWLTNSGYAHPYGAEFTVPTDWTNGTYTLYAHNGLGRKYGFADPLTITIQDPIVWDGTVYDVTQSPYNADNTGATEASTAIQAAIDAAGEDAGAQIYLPAGTYLIADSLDRFPDRVRFYGDGTNSTILVSDPTLTGDGMIDMLQDNLQNGLFEDFTMQLGLSGYASRYIHAGSTDFCTFRDIEFNSYPRASIETAGVTANAVPISGYYTTYMTVSNCVFISEAPSGSADNNTTYENCVFRGLWGANTQVSGAGQGAYFRGNVFSGYDVTDTSTSLGFAERAINGGGVHGSIMWTYMYQNRTVDHDPRGSYFAGSNEAEDFMFEGTYLIARGNMSAVSGTSLTMNTNTYLFGSLDDLHEHAQYGNPLNPADFNVYIRNGRGQGQARKIASHTLGSDTVVLEKPWTVEPDTDSDIAFYSLTSYQAVCYDNDFDGLYAAVTNENHVAGCAISWYDGATECYFDNNRATDTRILVDCQANANSHGGTLYGQSAFFNYYGDSSVTNARYISRIVIGDGNNSVEDEFFEYGNVFRNLYATNVVEDAFLIGMTATEAWLGLILYDQITAYCKNGIRDPFTYDRPGRIKNQIFKDCDFIGNGTGRFYSQTWPESSMSFVGCNISGFPTADAYPKQGTSDLVTPRNYITTTNSPDTIPVLSAGITNVGWSVADVGMIDIATNSGTVAAGGSGDITFSFTGSPDIGDEQVVSIISTNSYSGDTNTDHFVRFNGSDQFVPTGVDITADMKVEMRVRVNDGWEDYDCFFGSSTSPRYYAAVKTDGGTNVIFANTDDTQTTVCEFDTNTWYDIVFDPQNEVVTVNEFSATISTNVDTTTSLAFASRHGGAGCTPCDIAYFNIYTNDVLVRAYDASRAMPWRWWYGDSYDEKSQIVAGTVDQFYDTFLTTNFVTVAYTTNSVGGGGSAPDWPVSGSYLTLDGSDDWINITALLPTVRSNMTVEIDLDSVVTAEACILTGTSDYFALFSLSATDPVYNSTLVPVISVDDVELTPVVKRTVLRDALIASGSQRLAVRMNWAAYTYLSIGRLRTTNSGWNYGGNIYSIKIDDDSDGTWEHEYYPDEDTLTFIDNVGGGSALVNGGSGDLVYGTD